MKKTKIYTAIALACPAALLSGCYIVPIGSDQVDKLTKLVEQAQAASAAPAANAKPAAPAAAGASAAGSVALPARLYPMNDVATENGMISGSVTNMMNGKGRIQVSYRGEVLTGEATRVSGDDRKGVASAWGPSGSFMSCEYQMSAPVRGAGTCIFSDGARYQVHVGN